MKRWSDRLAHDLKGPLAPLQTAAFLLRSGALPPERQRELVDVIDRQTRRLNRMIEELGDFTRAEQNRLVTRRTPCALALVLDLALGAVPDVSTEPEYAAGTDAAEIDGDEARLVQLFATLLSHARARDPVHSAALRIEPAGDSVRVSVIDRGPAPEPDALATLFDAPQPAPADEGLGLGLMIAAAIAQAHDGRLDAHSADTGGLRIDCTLPRR
jgi:signal transduction histidine kinase